jgi:hypothetical protein
MSAISPKADIERETFDVRFVPMADMVFKNVGLRAALGRQPPQATLGYTSCL